MKCGKLSKQLSCLPKDVASTRQEKHRCLQQAVFCTVLPLYLLRKIDKVFL